MASIDTSDSGYMGRGGGDDDFDLPRYAPKLPSLEQHTARPNPYGAIPPPPPPQPASFGGLSSLHRSDTTGRQAATRLSASFEPDHVSLGRSASLGGAAAHPPRSRHLANHSDDLEQQHATQANSFYSPALGQDLNLSPRRAAVQHPSQSSTSHNDSGYAPSPSSYADAYGGTTSPSQPTRGRHPHSPQHSPSMQPYLPGISSTFTTPSSSSTLRPAYSTPGTPLSYQGGQSPQPQQHRHYYPPHAGDLDVQPMSMEAPRERIGFRRVRDSRDLHPHVNLQPAGRRADPTNGSFLSPLKCLTTQIAQTYNICNPQFRYETALNPRRVLTKPSKAAHNDGYDNEDYDYILYVNDWLGAEEGNNKYLILDVLGQGTFGQVVKCQNIKTHEIVAVKVVKNKPAYFNQSMMEVTILELLNNTWDPHDEHHILRLRDTFIHKSHLCLVFELLSSNLYELIKQNSFGGLSTQLVKVFTAQLLDSLTVLNEAKLIHCDLKPENILLKSLQSPQIKVIDFGSACHERQTVYTYIQSRFYRSPEVLLGLSYTSAIDMWSLGCIAVELFLGLPLFPGTSEYNQITRIVEMLGHPPPYMLEMGKQTSQFFSSRADEYGRKIYQLKSLEQYSREHGSAEQPGKKYFSATTLPEIIRTAPQPKSSNKPADLEKESLNRTAFIDFVQGLLNLDPIQRWSPQQARLHPFITGEKFVKPDGVVTPPAAQRSPAMTAVVDPKRPYGGLVPAQPKGTRAYSDAATYNQHLAQHQVYTAQAASQQAASQAYRNPYVNPPPTHQQYAQDDLRSDYRNVPPQASNALGMQTTQPHGQGHRLQHQQQPSYGALSVNNPHPPSSSYYPSSRGRANTINQRDAAVPPQLARIASMGMDAGISRNTLTPVLNREEAMQEWERRARGERQAPPAAYPQLEYLQQQAELATPTWNNPHRTHRYAPQQNSSLHQSSSLQHFQSPPSAVVVDKHIDQGSSGIRDVHMSTSRPPQAVGSSYDQQVNHHALPAPPQVYSSNSSSAARYAAATAAAAPSYPPSSSNAVPYDTFDHRDGLGTLFAPMQPSQLQPNNNGTGGGGAAYSSYNQPPTTPQQRTHPAVVTPGGGGSGGGSFYGAGVVASGSSASSTVPGQQRNMNPFAGATQQQGNMAPPPPQSKDPRRLSGMEIWPPR